MHVLCFHWFSFFLLVSPVPDSLLLRFFPNSEQNGGGVDLVVFLPLVLFIAVLDCRTLHPARPISFPPPINLISSPPFLPVPLFLDAARGFFVTFFSFPF